MSGGGGGGGVSSACCFFSFLSNLVVMLMMRGAECCMVASWLHVNCDFPRIFHLFLIHEPCRPEMSLIVYVVSILFKFQNAHPSR